MFKDKKKMGTSDRFEQINKRIQETRKQVNAKNQELKKLKEVLKGLEIERENLLDGAQMSMFENAELDKMKKIMGLN